MKIRMGFVSNSSSSSFVLYGVDEESAVGKVVAKAAKKKVRRKKDEDDWEYNSRIAEKISEIVGDDLEFKNDPEREGFWIGKNPCGMPDEMTMKQFKQSVVEKLSKICEIEQEEVADYCCFWNEEIFG